MPDERPAVAKTTVHQTKCCGMMEIDNLSASESPEKALEAIYLAAEKFQYFAWIPAFIIFTGIVELTESRKARKAVTMSHPVFRDENYGQDFADYLTQNGFGEVTASTPAVNRSSGNTLKVWVWAPKIEAIKGYFAAKDLGTIS